MNVIFVTSEAFPYAKTGGLADVAAALPKELAKKGHQVDVIMPCYPQIMKNLYSKLTTTVKLFGVQTVGNRTLWARVLTDKINNNLRFHFIEYNEFFDRPKLYDWNGKEYDDNAERFIFLSRAAMQLILDLNLKPDVMHLNDWHTALCAVYLKSPLYCNLPSFAKTKSILTIHNIGYQGVFAKEKFYWTGLNWNCFNHSCLEYHDCVNFLKGGIMCADRVNTVSPTYAQEILTKEFSFDLEGPLHHVSSQGKLSGILNGIDTEEWNAKTDKLIPYNFSVDDVIGKAKCKRVLQQNMKLPISPKTPIIGVVSRFAEQKGLDIFLFSIEKLLQCDDVQFAILGSGQNFLENRCAYLAEKYPEKFACYIGYDEKLSHLIEAGSDMFAMPSRYEPCGLNQMYSMLYGSVPIVRATGGLADTVINYQYNNLDKANGFTFDNLNGDSLGNTLKWALNIYHSDTYAFAKLRHNGMSSDFSWEKTAKEYEGLYQNMLNE